MSTTQILHGVGKAIIIDYKDKSKVVAHTNLENLSITSSYSSDDIKAGNKMFPIASFKTDMGLEVSAKSATFDMAMLPYLEGTEVTKGAVKVYDVLEVTIPEEGEVTLPFAAIDVAIDGFTKSGSADSKGQFAVSGKTVTFHEDDKGTVVSIVFSFNSSATAQSTGATEKAMPKPFEFHYIFPIYNEDSQQTHKGYFTVYKAQCTAGLKIDHSHQSAYAPEFSASARDPKRADGKYWNLTIDGVEVG